MTKKLPSQSKVVIIGGGVMGAGLLYHLAEEGWKDCLLIEKGELTSGSTWHAAGQCPSFIADYNMAKIHDYGVRLYPRLEELTGQYVSWHGCGGIRFASSPAEVEWFHRVAAVGKLIGFDCEIIDREKIKTTESAGQHRRRAGGRVDYRRRACRPGLASAMRWRKARGRWARKS